MNGPKIIGILQPDVREMYSYAWKLKTDVLPITESEWPVKVGVLAMARDLFDAARDTAAGAGDFKLESNSNRAARDTERFMDESEPLLTEADIEHLQELIRGR